MTKPSLSYRVKRMSLSKPAGFSGRHPFGFLNVSQFLSAFNDNLFKFLTIFLLIDIKGVASSNDILFFIGVAFVLPFLMFSSCAGVLADRFSKQKMIVFTKVLEIMIIGLAFFVYAHKMEFGCYCLVFLLSFQSALLGPSKYSIVPELVRRENIPKANGLLTSFTYLAIICGTFLATFLTDITGKNFHACLVVCMAAAVIGFITSLYIPHTEAKLTTTKIFTANVLTQVHKTMKFCKKTHRLRLAVLGSSFFLFIGGYLQLNVIPFAIDFLGMTETGGGYLFFATAVGIAIGALIGGKCCRKEVDLGLSCFGLLILCFSLIGLVVCSHSIVGAIISLVCLGVFGGMFVVPLDSYIQSFSPSEIRGQVIAAASFLSFFCLLLAPITLYLFGTVLNVSSRTGFIFIAAVIFIAFLVLVKFLSSAFLHFISKRLIQPFYDLHFINYPFVIGHQEDKIAVVLQKTSWLNLAILIGESSKTHIFIVKSKQSFMDKFFNLFTGINVLQCAIGEKPDPAIVHKSIDGLPSVIKPIFVFTCAKAYQYYIDHNFFENLSKDYNYNVKRFVLKNKSHFKPDWNKPLHYTQLTFRFENWSEKRLSHNTKEELVFSLKK